MEKLRRHPGNMPHCDIDVVIEDNGWHDVEFDIKQHVEKTAFEAVRLCGRCLVPTRVELCILLAGDQKLHELNKNYRNKDKPTNVLSFSYIESHHIDDDEPIYSTKHDDVNSIQYHPSRYKKEKDYCYLGDIAISYQRVRHESTENEKDIDEYVARMVVHGVLHLLLYDHETEVEAATMERKENDIMKSLGYGSD